MMVLFYARAIEEAVAPANGVGRQEFKRLGPQGFYKKVTTHPEEYQLLYANCHWIKRHENKEACGRPSTAKA